MELFEKEPWFVLYKAALIETDSEILGYRIAVAERAVALRLRELEVSESQTSELERLYDARRALGVLREEAFKKSRSVPGTAHSES